jgi:dimeric dUTPase (all-alpha-NTP-PPase superfamily)
MVNIKNVELDWGTLRLKYGEDGLVAVFARQKELMEKYHFIEEENGAQVPDALSHGNLDYRLIQYRIKEMAYRVIEELSEATNCLKNKPWKQDAVLTDKDHFYEELADAFHFFVELCIIAGLNAEEFMNLYFKKSEVNKFRQRSGY